MEGGLTVLVAELFKGGSLRTQLAELFKGGRSEGATG